MTHGSKYNIFDLILDMLSATNKSGVLSAPFFFSFPSYTVFSQTSSRVEDPLSVRQPCFPPGGRISSGPAIPHLPLLLPPTQDSLLNPVRVRQHMDHLHPRRRIPRAQTDGTHHQRFSSPHRPPPLLRLQLRAVLHPVGPHRRLLPLSFSLDGEGAARPHKKTDGRREAELKRRKRPN